MLYYFLLYSKVNQLYIDIYPFLFGFPSHLSHHKALSRVPCAVYSWFSLVMCFIQSGVYLYPSQPPKPSHTLPPTLVSMLFFMSMSLFLFCKEAHIFLDST